MTRLSTRRWDGEVALVAALAACVSLAAFFFYFRHGALLLYGDSAAHINIARRVFDSRTPGLLQLGTVWLPLPHLLMIPFLLPDWMWQTGAGGSIPSMLAYVFSVAGIFRLARGVLSFRGEHDGPARMAAWAAVIIFAANPNILYLQSTAMTETLCIAFLVWAVVHFVDLAQQMAWRTDQPTPGSSLTKCGLCLLGAASTRYDGWFLAAVTCLAVMGIALRAERKPSRRELMRFGLLACAGPVLWIAYNAIVYRNPLEFANGRYSAWAIQQRAVHAGVPPHPGDRDQLVASSYFLKCVELNLAEGQWQKFWLGILLVGLLIGLFNRRLRPMLLVMVPLPFYVLSMAYGGVPIYLPVWWPFSYYNVRFGPELLPACAVFGALVLCYLTRLISGPAGRAGLLTAMLLVVAASYASVWRARPITLREAWTNSRTRMAFEGELAAQLKQLPPDSTLLMYLGDHPAALQQVGIPLRRVIYEGNHRTWKEPYDPQGEWERALENPASFADYVVAMDGDPVAEAMRKQSLPAMVRIHVNGQPAATVYQTGRAAR